RWALLNPPLICCLVGCIPITSQICSFPNTHGPVIANTPLQHRLENPYPFLIFVSFFALIDFCFFFHRYCSVIISSAFITNPQHCLHRRPISELIAMAGYLNKYGLISWFSQTVVKVVGGLGLSWQMSFGILVLLYFYSHYFFASGAAHIGAMFTAFLSGALVLSFLSNLMGGITHYGIGSAPVFYGAGYVPLAKWWGYGFLISVVNIIIWLGVGGIWWKAIDLW
ncbi:hypothetical protein ES332_A07G233400v1, partial [Gossypium tomentosum]